MNYQSYEDYMRSVLGYPINSPDIYEPYDYRNSQNYEDTYYQNEYVSNLSEEEIRGLYPEIYHLVYPMVCKVCAVNSQPLTGELIEKMTDEVYNAIEDTSTVVNVRIDAKREDNEPSNRKTEARSETRTPISAENSRVETRIPIKAENRSEVRPERRSEVRTENRRISERENRDVKESRESRVEKTSAEMQVNAMPRESRISNFTLRDLIKILILNRLFGGNRPHRPPHRPPRPPFPGGPGMPPRPPTRPPFPGGRPPMRPRTDIQDSMQKNYNDYLAF